jgi:gamma-glutamyltranspeptidase/glutathione hydrolase
MKSHTGRTQAGTRVTSYLSLAITALTACTDPEFAEFDDDDDDDPADLEWREYSAPSYPDARMQDDVGAAGPGPSPYYKKGVVATSESLAALAGRKVLADGYDALDAAVVTQAMLNVVEPQSSGIGGGGLWLVYLAGTNQTHVIDCRERAPGKATATMLASQSSTELKETSGITVGVPATLHCMQAALDLRPGGMTLAQALQPAIDAATAGTVVSTRLAADSNSSRLKNELGNPAYDEARKVFRPGGQSLVAGSTLKQPQLAHAFTQVKNRGLAAFFDCADSAGIANAIVATQKARRSTYSGGVGRMECSDLKAFKPVITAPLSRTYDGYTVVTTQPPSSGVFLLQMLGILERFDLGKANYGFGQTYTLNVMQEAMRMAFADRALWLGDPEKVSVPVTGLLSKAYVDLRSSKITVGKRLSSVTAGDPRPYDGGSQPAGEPLSNKPNKDKDANGTTHFVVADGEGNIVAVTATISNTWGTGLMVPLFGFMLNNQLINFNDTPQLDDSPYNPGANDVAPFKRPRTTLSPALVFLDGKPIAAMGSPGSTTIVNAVLEFIVDLADFRMTLQQAVAAPRFSLDSATGGASTDIESGFSATVRKSLTKMGYKFTSASALGAVQAVIINQFDGRKYGTADPRRIGAVAGIQ